MDSSGARRIGLYILSISVALACHAPAERDHGRPVTGHVLVIGLDGATWDLMHPLILRGALPNIERIRREGAWGVLQSDEPMASPRLWATIATGRTPDAHGITGFYKKTSDGTEVTRTNLDRRARAVWNILSERERRSTVVGWFYSWPADEILGSFISDRSEGPMAGGHHPPDLETMLASIADAVSPRSARADAERFLGPSPDPDRTPLQVRREMRSLEETLEDYLRVDRLRLEWTLELMRERPSELTAVFFKGIDALSHLLWIHMDPESFESDLHPPEPVRRRFEATLPRYYEFLDEAIGALLQNAPPRTDVVIVSDHGFGPEPDPTMKLAYDLNPVLSRLGWIVVDANGRPDPDRSVVVDATPHWRKTHRERSLWVNTRIVAAQGSGDLSSGMQDLVEQLSTVGTSGGEHLFDEVEIDSESDCVVDSDTCLLGIRIAEPVMRGAELRAGLEVSGTYRLHGEEHPLSELAAVRVEFTGSHRMEGILLMAGPRIRRGAMISDADVYDVAPTVLRLLGLPRSREMPGQVLEAALRSDLLAPPARPVRSYEREAPIPRVGVDLAAEEARDEERRLQDRLKTLGYVN